MLLSKNAVFFTLLFTTCILCSPHIVVISYTFLLCKLSDWQWCKYTVVTTCILYPIYYCLITCIQCVTYYNDQVYILYPVYYCLILVGGETKYFSFQGDVSVYFFLFWYNHRLTRKTIFDSRGLFQLYICCHQNDWNVFSLIQATEGPQMCRKIFYVELCITCFSVLTTFIYRILISYFENFDLRCSVVTRLTIQQSLGTLHLTSWCATQGTINVIRDAKGPYWDLVSLNNITLYKKATIHQVTTMLAIYKNVLFPGHNHLITTGTDDALIIAKCQRSEGSSVPVVSGWLWSGKKTFLDVAGMVVTWWILAFLRSGDQFRGVRIIRGKCVQCAGGIYAWRWYHVYVIDLLVP